MMELDWFCIGVLKVSHLCYMKGFCELFSWVSTKAHVGMRCLIINTQANRVVIISSVITRIFLTLFNAWAVTFQPISIKTLVIYLYCA
jgi:hypothetical protein